MLTKQKFKSQPLSFPMTQIKRVFKNTEMNLLRKKALAFTSALNIIPIQNRYKLVIVFVYLYMKQKFFYFALLLSKISASAKGPVEIFLGSSHHTLSFII